MKSGILIAAAAYGCLLTPRSARSQEQEAGGQNSGDQTQSKSAQPAYAAYAVEETEQNAVILDLTSGASYDDNVFANNQDRVQDELYSVGGTFGVNENRSRYDFTLLYRPTFIGYGQFNSYNQFNHDLIFQGEYHATPHLDLTLQDTTDYFRGLFETAAAETSFSPVAPLPSLNETIYTPLVDEFSSQTRVDAVDRVSPNGTADLFATFEDRKFGSSPLSEALFNTLSGAAGLTYTYQLTRTWSVAPAYSYQKLTFGSSSRAAFQSGTVNLTWNATPTFAIEGFGGEQYVELNESIFDESLVSGTSITSIFSGNTAFSPINLRRWYPEYGASVSRQIQHFQLQLSGEHLATDGGGVLTSVSSTQGDLQLRWILTEHWEARLTGEDSKTLALSPAFSGGRLQSQTGGFALVRRFSPRWSATLGYGYTRQRVGGTLPFFYNMDRNIASISITYRILDFRLGR